MNVNDYFVLEFDKHVIYIDFNNNSIKEIATIN